MYKKNAMPAPIRIYYKYMKIVQYLKINQNSSSAYQAKEEKTYN